MNSQLEQMRQWGRILNLYCILWLYNIEKTCVFEDNPKSGSNQHLESIIDWNRNICFGLRGACSHCLKIVHNAKICDIFVSLQEFKRRLCRPCFINQIERHRIHMQIEFGCCGTCLFELFVKHCLLWCHGEIETRFFWWRGWAKTRKKIRDAKFFRRRGQNWWT